MKHVKLMIFIVFLFFALLAMTAVSADNSTDTNITADDSPVRTYADLNKCINETDDGGLLNLNESYRYTLNCDEEFFDGVNITKNITIVGQNNNYIDGAKTARCLFIASNCKVLLENLTICNGYSQNSGAGIFLSPNSQLIITNCTFHHNYVYNSDGGAIDGEEDTCVEIYHSLFYNNNAHRESDLEWEEFKAGMGSVVCMRIGSTLKIEDCVIRANRGTLTTILVITYDDVNRKLSRLYVKNCLFEDNNVSSSGVIYLDEFGYGEIYDSVFRNNVARNKAGTVVLDASEYAIVKNCTFESNSAVKGGAIFIKVFEEIYGSKIDIVDCNFTNNTASLYGGAIYSKLSDMMITNCNFISNTAVEHGGAIGTISGKTTIVNSNFIGNTGGYGGALYLKSDKVTIKSVSLIQNTATVIGGAVYSTTLSVTTSDVTYSKNTAPSTAKVYGVFNVKVTVVKVKSKSTKMKVKITSPWKVSTSQKFKITLKGPRSYTSKWLKTNSNGKLSFYVPFKFNKYEYSVKVTMKNGPVKLTLWAKKDTGKVSASKSVKKPKKIIIKVKNKKNKPIKKIKFKVKVYTDKKYKTYTVKSNAKGIIKIKTSKLKKGTHKVNVKLSNSIYCINKNFNVKIK